MKYLKVIVGVGLIPLGVLGGTLISLGGGSGALLGGILGLILCCMLFWSFWPHWPGSANLDELYQDNSDKKIQAIDKTVRSMREAKIEDELRYKGLHGRW